MDYKIFKDRKFILVIGLIVCVVGTLVIGCVVQKKKNQKIIEEVGKNQQAVAEANTGGNIFESPLLQGDQSETQSGLEDNEEVDEVDDEETTEEDSSESDNKVEEVKTVNSTSNEALESFVNKAVSQLGSKPDGNGVTVYGKWYQDNVDGSDNFSTAAWCAMFISWCANDAGISSSTVGYFAECSSWEKNFYIDKGLWHSPSGYTPARGDIIFFDNHNNDGVTDHNGIVESVTSSDVIVIEGNVDNEVKRCTYSLSDPKIHGYGKPNYSKNSENVAADNKAKEKQQAEARANANVSTSGGSTGQAEKIISVAASQLGYGENGDGWTKFGQWYQDNIDGSCYFANQAWCAMFVSWCANEAGVSRDILTPYAYCGYGIQYFKNKGDWHDRSSGYVPKRGDVIFFGADRHTGLVDHSEGGMVYTIEGNSTNDSVARKTYSLSYSDINGYGSPKYN